MQAALFDRYGPAEVLRLRDLPVPTPQPDEVLVRVAASSVNGGEVAARRGALRLLTGRKFPKRTGIDFAGTVAAAGPGVDDTLLDADVWGVLDERGATGSHSGYVTTTADRIVVAPRNLAPADAVSLLAGGTTGLRGLRDIADLRPGERLLVRGAAGGVGSVAVQIGKMLGAHVTGLASPRTSDFVTGLGADEVIDYRTPLSSLGKYDVVFDTRGTEHARLRRLLGRGGRLVTIAFDIDRPFASLGYIALSTLHGSTRVRLFFGTPRTELLKELTTLAEEGSLRPVVDEVYPLERIAEAHTRFERGGVAGKIVLTDR
ncbi:NAD(P)-dependent alcohol dehydrogenase [Microbacterium marinilacus]|nr:NAD(P)-dependent alcohol dehydrogenase [Microbacterium marinilacus]